MLEIKEMKLLLAGYQQELNLLSREEKKIEKDGFTVPAWKRWKEIPARKKQVADLIRGLKMGIRMRQRQLGLHETM